MLLIDWLIRVVNIVSQWNDKKRINSKITKRKKKQLQYNRIKQNNQTLFTTFYIYIKNHAYSLY